jgi:hypothetical protein
MSEPPRLSPAENPNFFGNEGGHPFQRAPFPPASTASGVHALRLLLLAFSGTFLLMFLLCSGGAWWGYRQFTAKNPMTEGYREHRDQPGDSLPEAVAARLQTAEPVNREEWLELCAFVDALAAGELAGDAAFDFSRAVEEMQASGLATGMNWLNKMFHVLTLSESFEPPEIGSNPVIISVDWLVPQKEARVAVMSVDHWEEYPLLHLLYVKRSVKGWRLYDHRDLLQPLSETQYYAIYTSLPYSAQAHYHDLYSELLKIYNDYSLDASQKSKRSVVALQRFKFPGELRQQAQYLTIHYLNLYEHIPTLDPFLADPVVDGCLAVPLARGRLALLKGDKAAAFEEAERMMSKVGWHPAAAVLAGKAADSDTERKQASDWLAQLLKRAPAHPSAINAFFRVADSVQMERYVEQLAAREHGEAELLSVLRAGYIRECIPQLLRTQAMNQLPVAILYLEFTFAAAEGWHAQALAAARELFQQPGFAALDEHLSQNSSEPLLESQILQQVVDVLEEYEDFESMLEQFPRRTALLRQLRSRVLLYRQFSADWDRRGKWMEWVVQDPVLADDPETKLALAACRRRLGEPMRAMDLLLELLTEQRNQVLSDGFPSDLVYGLVDLLGQTAVETARWRELIEQMDEPEVAYLILRQGMGTQLVPGRLADEVDAWYAQQAGAPQCWREYFHAVDAYQVGQWETADEHLFRALTKTAQDGRSHDDDFRPVIHYLLPTSDSGLEWEEERVNWAMRCGKLAELANSLIQNGEFQSDVFEWSINRSGDAEDLRALAEAIKNTASGNAVGIDRERLMLLIRARQAILADDPRAAFQAYADQFAADRPRVDTATDTLLDLGLLADSLEPLGDMLGLSAALDAKAAQTTLSAVRAGDSAGVVEALKGYSGYAAKQYWTSSLWIERLKEAGVWEAVNEGATVDLFALENYYPASGALLLTTAASGLLPTIEATLQQSLGEQLTRVDDLDRLPDAVGAWIVDTPLGRLLAVAYDEPPRADVDDPVAEAILADIQGLVSISYMQRSTQAAPVQTLRQLSLEWGERWPVSGYYDLQTRSLYRGDDWREQLRGGLVHGINRTAPRELKITPLEFDDRFGELEGQHAIGRGFVVELLSVESVDSQAAAGLDFETRRLIQGSLLFPVLSAGDRIESF